jgi:hypothetical protein
VRRFSFYVFFHFVFPTLFFWCLVLAVVSRSALSVCVFCFQYVCVFVWVSYSMYIICVSCCSMFVFLHACRISYISYLCINMSVVYHIYHICALIWGRGVILCMRAVRVCDFRVSSVFVCVIFVCLVCSCVWFSCV